MGGVSIEFKLARSVSKGSETPLPVASLAGLSRTGRGEEAHSVLQNTTTISYPLSVRERVVAK